MLLFAAMVTSIAAAGFLALSMDVHWEQVRADPQCSPRMVRLLRILGAACVVASLVLCLGADHVSMASLVWFMTLAGAALVVTFTLSWRPRWLRPLVMWIPATTAREEAGRS
ncbi:hypothetical protein J2W28_001656 [Variovorax boronicumulans]|uniref:DUF3325 domain-containing protein n=1 Tax=Variovorax boronicumulans TaxID=436515 RepID=UPI0027822F14|nr:DUF3325 domain-containing protein [Variovorax boronicumulans]MDP9992312.1 hypothetical protein [Variovorax boronicumulans]MDQ0002516.1 hypothetical protein [Variovorax boronicumulans]